MNSSVRLAAALLCAVFVASASSAQVISQPTPAPLVTADSEPWYLGGDPIVYAGNLYYPAGAQVAFNSNEMIRSGFHLGVPLYTRTTDEPFSVVYVPLARGFMHPYMRRRTGDVAGTAGTTAPSGAAAAYSPAGVTVPIYQAAGPPTLVAGPPSDSVGQPRGTIGAVPPTERRGPLGTTGSVGGEARPAETTGRAPAPVRPTHTQIGPRPQGLNAVFVEYAGRRWFGEGQPVPLDRNRMTQVGEHLGFPVFVDRNAPEQRIYVATAAGGSLVTPYKR